MKACILRLLAAVTAGIALVWCWQLLNREAEPAPRRTVKTTLGPRHSPAPDSNAPRPAPSPKPGTPKLADRVREKGNAWLATRGRDAAGLVALWDLTHDDALLDEAAKRFPDEPLVCLAMIDRLCSDPRAALVWIEHLIVIEPGNSMGQHLRSWALFQSGDHDGAFAALYAGVGIGRQCVTHHRDRLVTLETAIAACGLPAREAALAALRFQQDNDFTTLTLGSVHGLIEPRAKQFSGADDSKQLEITVELGYTAVQNNGCGNTFGFPRTVAHEAAAFRVVCLLNDHFQDHWQLTKNFSSPAARQWAIDESVRITQTVEAAKSVAQRLESAPDDIVVEYARLIRDRSERRAIAWLVENTEPWQSSAPLLDPSIPRP